MYPYAYILIQRFYLTKNIESLEKDFMIYVPKYLEYSTLFLSTVKY